MNNGGGPFTAKVMPKAGTTFCDGAAHTITVEKAGIVAKVTVDALPSVSVTGPKGVTSADTKGVVYLGGIPSKNLYIFCIYTATKKVIILRGASPV